jgi:hypothetical protein
MSALKSIALVVGISALYCGLVFTGYAFAGAGHGSDFFGTALLAPFSASESLALLGFVLWQLSGFFWHVGVSVGARLLPLRFSSFTMSALWL